MFLLFWGFKGETLQQLLVNPEAERTLQEGKQYLQRAISEDSIRLQMLTALLSLPPAAATTSCWTTVTAAHAAQSEPTGTTCVWPTTSTSTSPTPSDCLPSWHDPPQQPADEAERLMSHALCARLAEACCRMACSNSSMATINGHRVAFGYATCPDHSLKRIVFDLLDAEERLAVSLTDHYSIQPSTSVCGLFICHPEARYFPVGRIDEDQLADYCRRRGITSRRGRTAAVQIYRNNNNRP